ncbi:MAG: pyrroloquinoline quinone biosynthesis peptide chaperone PqqD [Pseudomonadota bacterium]
MTDLADSDVPYLPRGVRLKHCKVRQGWYLLAPERAVKLDQVAAAILGTLDGARSFTAVVDRLASDFNAPRGEIAKDAREFLIGMMNRRMVEAR